MDYLEYRKKYFRKTQNKKKSVPIWRCPDGIIWRICFHGVQKNCWFLKQCILRQPFFFGTGLFSLVVYFIYIFYSRNYTSYLQLRNTEVFSDSDYGMDGYQGRVEKSSVMVNKVIENQKHRSLLIHGKKAENENENGGLRHQVLRGDNRENEKETAVYKAKVFIYSEKHVDTLILSDSFNMLSEVKYIHEPLLLTDYEGMDATQKAELYRNILRCNFQSLHRFSRGKWQEVYAVRGEGMDRKHKYKYEKVFCFEGGATSINCPSKVVHLEDLCSLKRHRVVKVGSVRHVKQLAGLLEYGYQIVHVVRDPRTVLAAKLKNDNNLDNTEKHLNHLQIYCNEIERDVAYIKENFMRYRSNNQTLYRLVRYEDIEKSPVDKMREMFQSLSIDLQDEDENQLVSNQMYFQEETQNDKDLWKYLSIEGLKRVEQYCELSMELLGYSKMKNFDNLHQIDPHNLVEPTFELQYLT